MIGQWFEGLQMKPSDVVWGAGSQETYLNDTYSSDESDEESTDEPYTAPWVPKSVCSEPCGVGAVKKMTEVC